MGRVGILGAFSIDNPGDALLGLAARQLLAARLPDTELELFAPAFPGAHWGHDAGGARAGVPITMVPPDAPPASWARGLDALVIGGGGLLNFSPAFRPFLLGGVERWDGPPAAWLSVCSLGTPWYGVRDAWPLVARCCAQLSWIGVRSAAAAKLVRHCGYDGPATIVPDLTFGMAPPDGADRDALLARHGVDPARFLIGVSPGNSLADPRAAGYWRALAAALGRLRTEEGAQLVVLPFGGVYRDAELVRRFSAMLPGAILLPALPPRDVWRVIGRLRVYVACRYHAVLAALTQDVAPVIVDEYYSDATAASKHTELAHACDLEPYYTAPLVTRDPSVKLGFAVELARRGGSPFAAAREAQAAALGRAVDAMVAALGLR